MLSTIATWADSHLSEEWGTKAAARVFHICDSGKDVEIDSLFAGGAATKKPIRYAANVPGCPERATTKYDVSQAMSFVATQRNNTEERLALRSPLLLHRQQYERLQVCIAHHTVVPRCVKALDLPSAVEID